jgi:prevent-host-death family protein
MKILTIAEFRGNLKKYLDLVTDYKEPILINRSGSKGAVVIPLDEYNSINLKTSLTDYLEKDIRDYFAIKNINFLLSPVYIFSKNSVPQLISFKCISLEESSFSVEFVFTISDMKIALRDKKGESLKYDLETLLTEISDIISKRIEIYNKSLIS